MVFDQRGNHQGHGSCSGRNHAGPAASKRNDGGNGKRGVQAHLGINARNDGKRDGLRDQCEGYNQASEYIASDVEKPALFDVLK